ncbi:MAG TPA: hypothetical protein VMW80_07280 [Candidatus Dormibacteraeota bacterium]|nr:hypothetical protein [Candidatus Dormibacteraeota bacterium]
MAFKRASLSGSAQLFQPTKVPAGDRPDAADEPIPMRSRPAVPSLLADDPAEGDRGPILVSEIPSIPLPHGHLYRLSDDEVELLLEALQHAKFPHSYQRLPKPAMDEFEQLEALRQKIADQREAGG